MERLPDLHARRILDSLRIMGAQRGGDAGQIAASGAAVASLLCLNAQPGPAAPHVSVSHCAHSRTVEGVGAHAPPPPCRLPSPDTATPGVHTRVAAALDPSLLGSLLSQRRSSTSRQERSGASALPIPSSGREPLTTKPQAPHPAPSILHPKP